MTLVITIALGIVLGALLLAALPLLVNKTAEATKLLPRLALGLLIVFIWANSPSQGVHIPPLDVQNQAILGLLAVVALLWARAKIHRRRE